MSPIESAHARYRQQLEALAGSDVVLAAVHAAGEGWGWPEWAGWRRMHERFEPDGEPYATCVLATSDRPQHVVRVEAFRDVAPEPAADTCVVRAGAAGVVRVRRNPPDPGLATLDDALAGRRTIVRYHPARRCTIRVDEDQGTRFVKVYADGRGERVHADGLELWRAADRGELGFVVAKPERFDPELQAVWQESVEGNPVKDRLHGPRGEELAEQVGRAAGSLPCSGVRPRERRDPRTELARSASRCAELERRVPELGDSARRLLAALEAAHAAFNGSESRPVHGALHASQWLENGSGLALLDYDSLALGDPEVDAATFLADLDVQNRKRVPVDRLTAAFLSAYEAAAGPLDPRLLATYRAHRRLEKTLRVARSLRPDGDRKAGRRLRRALEYLEGSG